MIRFAAAAIAFLVAPALVSAQAPDGALKKIRDTKSVTIAYRTDAVPFSFADEKGQPPAIRSISASGSSRASSNS